MVKKDKPGVLRPEEVYDSGNEPSNEDELRAYQSRFGIPTGAQGEAGQSCNTSKYTLAIFGHVRV